METNQTRALLDSIKTLYNDGNYSDLTVKNQQEPYLYIHLDPQEKQIRLFTLFPGAFDEPLCGTLEIHRIDNCPRFIALSYAWGDPNLVRPIALHGKQAAISRNLDIALRHIRQSGCCTVLWVDAICINQLDIAERNHQVGMMDLVYSSAHEVYAWIGVAVDESDAIIDMFDMTQKRGWLAYSEEFCWQKVMSTLIDRPYWSRMWIVQEVSLSVSDPMILCGWKRLPWSHFMFGLSLLEIEFAQYSRSLTVKSLKRVLRLKQVRSMVLSSEDKTLSSLTQALTLTKEFEASDPRDKIYGCLSLLPQSVRDHIRPDYSASKCQIFADVTKHCLQQENSSFFSIFSAPDIQEGCGPSWAPDFSKQETATAKDPTSQTDTRSHWLITPRSISFKAENRHLLIEGAMIDTITECVTLKSGLQALANQIPQLERLAQHAAKKPLHNCSPFFNLERKSTVIPSLLGHKSFGTDFSKKSWDDLVRKSRWRQLKRDVEFFAIYKSMFETVQGRVFFITNSGFSGIAVARIERSDVVTLLGGERLPIILRPRGSSYIIVGAAHVPGLLDDKAVDLYEKRIIERTVIRIS